MKVCKQLLASGHKANVVKAAAAGVFTRETCHSSRASSELCLSMSDGQTRLPNSLSVLFTLFFPNVGSNSAANRAGAAYNLGGGWSIHLYRCGSQQQDAFTANMKGSQ